jgi:hypothetical protein
MRTRSLIALLLGLPAIAGRAQYWAEQVIPPPLDVTSTGQFGWSLSIEGDYLLVGAPGSDVDGPNAGAAYIFRREEGGTNDWDLLMRLAPPLLSDNARFGATVLLRDGWAFVGAPHQRIGLVEAGAVFVFGQFEGGPEVWGYHQRLAAQEPVAAMEFGSSIELRGDTLLAGMPGLLPPGPFPDVLQAGGFAKFGRSTDGSWSAQGSTYLRWAGRAGLAYSGLFLTSKLANDGDRAGYFLKFDSLWSSTGGAVAEPAEQELNLAWPNGNPWGPPNVDPDINLSGPSMAASGPYLAVSDVEAINAIDTGPEPDVTITLDIPLVAVLTGLNDTSLEIVGYARADGNGSTMRFGNSVAFIRDRLAVGDPGADIGNPAGNVRLFGLTRVAGTDSLPLVATLYPANPAFGDLFGWSLAARDGTIAVGSPGHGTDDKGQVHVFLDPTTGTPDAQDDPNGPLIIWPNPASGFIDIRCPWTTDGDGQFQLIDVTGRTVLRAPMRRAVERIDTGRLAPGPYTLILSGAPSAPSRASAQVIIQR